MLTVLCSEIRFFAKPRNDVTKSLRASVTSPGGFAVRSPFRDFVHLKVLQNAKHFAKPPGVGQHTKSPPRKQHIWFFPTQKPMLKKPKELFFCQRSTKRRDSLIEN